MRIWDINPGYLSRQQLWAQHKYSVLARDPGAYRSIGTSVAAMHNVDDLCALAADLTTLLRQPPPQGQLFDALQHMWGHVSSDAAGKGRDIASLKPQRVQNR